jgi:hypothetical protein
VRRAGWKRPALALCGLLLVAGCGSAGEHAGAASHKVNRYFDGGQTVLITASGFRPRTLICAAGRRVVWKNATPHRQRVIFDHQPVRSQPIPPGGTFSFTPIGAVSLLYHSSGNPRMDGQLQAQPGSP